MDEIISAILLLFIYLFFFFGGGINNMLGGAKFLNTGPSMLEYLINVYEITEKYKLQADNIYNIPTRHRKDKISYYYEFSLRIKMMQNLI
jgi:hypothetical protein